MENLELNQSRETTSFEAYTELLFRVIFQAPLKSNALFIHAHQNLEYSKELLATAAKLYYQGYAPHIVINSLTLEAAKAKNVDYHGVAAWRQLLIEEHTIPATAILEIEASNNTPEESKNFLKLAEERGWKSAIIMAVPYQLVRAFLQIVSLLNDQKKLLLVIPQTCHVPMDWDASVSKTLLGGGVLEGSRGYHVQQEATRIFQYMRGCDPKFTHQATIEEGLKYLQRVKPDSEH